MRHELPSGNWVEFTDPRKISEKTRRPITIAMAKLSVEAQDFYRRKEAGEDIDGMSPSAEDVATILEINDATACALISATNLNMAIPVTVDALLDLPGDDYDAIVQAAQMTLFTQGLYAATAVPSNEPDSPTVPSDA